MGSGQLSGATLILACRNCRVPLTAENGCAICAPIKKHLVTVDESEDEKPSLSDVAAGVVSDLQYARRFATKVMRDDDADPKVRMDATARILKIGNTASKVLEAARKLQTDGLAAIRNMSFLERAELFITWYTALPPPYRSNLRSKMDEFEASTNKALPPGATASE